MSNSFSLLLRAGDATALLGSELKLPAPERIMNQPKQQTDPAVKGNAILDEADIGSGEKTPAQRETEEMIRQIPPLPAAGQQQPGQNQDQAPNRQPPAGRP
jgi:hypothetical protein